MSSAKTDFYQTLGVAKTATAEEIKAAYRKLALQNHPDRNKGADAESKFKQINEAYQVLSDKEKKAAYDQFGHAAFEQGGGAGGPFGGGFGGAGGFGGFPGGRTGPFQWSYTTSGGESPFGDMGIDPFEVFESFFGGGFGGARGRRRPRYGMTIEFFDAVKGVEKQVEIEKKKRTVKIPAGVADGTRIQFDDFDLIVSVREHEVFKRDGDDVYADHDLPYTVAALGGVVEVKTLTGSLKLKVRSGTQTHSLVRLRGEGIPHVRGGGKGDLYIRYILKVPQKLSKEEQRLLEELQRVQSRT